MRPGWARCEYSQFRKRAQRIGAWRWHTPLVTSQGGARSVLATIVGYLIVAAIVVVLFNFVIGTVLWLFRALIVVVAILALITIYLRLKTPD